MSSERKRGCACGGPTVRRNVKPRVPGETRKNQSRNSGRLFGFIPGSNKFDNNIRRSI